MSLISSSGVPVEEIARLAGHSNTKTTGVVYRCELRPVLATGAEAMDKLFPSSSVPRLSEVVVAEDVPGVAGGPCGGAAVGGEAGGQVSQRAPGRVGCGEEAGGVGVPLPGLREHAEQFDAVAGVHPVAATVPLLGGLADQVFGVGELAPVPGGDALGVRSAASVIA